jgi:hypothetical protein
MRAGAMGIGCVQHDCAACRRRQELARNLEALLEREGGEGFLAAALALLELYGRRKLPTAKPRKGGKRPVQPAQG